MGNAKIRNPALSIFIMETAILPANYIALRPAWAEQAGILLLCGFVGAPLCGVNSAEITTESKILTEHSERQERREPWLEGTPHHIYEP